MLPLPDRPARVAGRSVYTQAMIECAILRALITRPMTPGELSFLVLSSHVHSARRDDALESLLKRGLLRFRMERLGRQSNESRIFELAVPRHEANRWLLKGGSGGAS